MTDGLLTHLEQIKTGYQGQKEHLDSIIQTSENELVQITSAIRKLEERRLLENQKKYKTLEALDQIRHEQQEEVLNLIFQEFNAFQRFMANYLEQNLDVRENIQRQLDAMLAQDPTLERDLTEYHEFMAKAGIALQSIPAFYRKSFEQAVQLQAQRLQNCLELEIKLKAIPDRSDGIVPIVLTIDKEHYQMFLALPAAIRTETQDKNFSQRMDGLENAFLQFLTKLAKDPDWTLLEIERGDWSGFRSLTTLIEYTGQIPIRDSVQEYLEQWLLDSWPFKNLTPIPELAELDWKTWLIGKSRSGAELDLKAVVPVEEAVPLPEPLKSLGEPTFRLFSEKDIIAWDRPLRVSEDSSWTISARRLRTLVMRFAAQGRIGKNGVSAEQIIGGLPREHAVCLEKLFPILVETGVFCSDAVNGNATFSLDPSHLSDVQDLINRDVTQFWIPLVA